MVSLWLVSCSVPPAYMKGVQGLPPQSRRTLDVDLDTARGAILYVLTHNGYAIGRTQDLPEQMILEGERSLQEGREIHEIRLTALLTRVSAATSVALTARETVRELVRSWPSFPLLLKLFLPYGSGESGTYLLKDAMIEDPRFYEAILQQAQQAAADLRASAANR